MVTKDAKKQAVQAIRQIVQAARQLAEAEQVLLRETPLPERKRSRVWLNDAESPNGARHA